MQAGVRPQVSLFFKGFHLMSPHIQSLESRTLLSVTKATLLADHAALLAEAKTARANVSALFVTLTHDNKAVQTDLKGQSASAPLLKTLMTDESRTKVLIGKDLNSLLGPALALGNKTIAAGLASLSHSSTALQTKIAADLTALNSVIAAPLAKLNADLQAVPIPADLQNILDANPSNSTLASDISTLQNDLSTNGQTFSTAVSTFQTNVSTTASDVSTTPGGTGGTTIPTLSGTYTGSTTATAGTHVGRVSSLSITITSETADGTLTGTAVNSSGSGPINLTFTGSINSSGAFTLNMTDPTDSTQGASLTGQANGTTLSGTFTAISDSGTFTLSQ